MVKIYNEITNHTTVYMLLHTNVPYSETGHTTNLAEHQKYIYQRQFIKDKCIFNVVSAVPTWARGAPPVTVPS